MIDVPACASRTASPVTSDIADTVYKCAFLQLHPGGPSQGIRYDDPDLVLNGPWPSTGQVSHRDRNAPLLKDVAETLPW